MEEKIVLELSKEQADLVRKACEFYARVRIGQFGEIIFHCMDVDTDNNYFERRERAEEFLLAARNSIYPDLHGAGHSYGMGKFQDADMAFDVHQVIRKELYGNEPFSYNPLPVCYRKSN